LNIITFFAGGISVLGTQNPGGNSTGVVGGAGADGGGVGGSGVEGGVGVVTGGGGGVVTGGVGGAGVEGGVGVVTGGVGGGVGVEVGGGVGVVTGGVVGDTMETGGMPPDPQPDRKIPGTSKREIAALEKIVISSSCKSRRMPEGNDFTG
jgi:hypothetical protein